MTELSTVQSRAAHAYTEQRYLEAVTLYQQCLEIDPTQTINYWWLGLSFLLSGDVETAQEIWLSALLGETPEAIDHQALELQEILKTEAEQHRKYNRLIESEVIYWQLLELYPDDAKTWINLGENLGSPGSTVTD